jgi:hypothetical protein
LELKISAAKMPRGSLSILQDCASSNSAPGIQREKETDKMTRGEQWAKLCKESRAAHDAVTRFPLYEGGWMVNDRLDEYQALEKIEREIKEQMDSFIAEDRAAK